MMGWAFYIIGIFMYVGSNNPLWLFLLPVGMVFHWKFWLIAIGSFLVGFHMFKD